MQRAENREIYHGTTDETYTFGLSKDPDSKYRIYYLLSYLLNKSGNLFGDENDSFFAVVVWLKIIFASVRTCFQRFFFAWFGLFDQGGGQKNYSQKLHVIIFAQLSGQFGTFTTKFCQNL